MTAKVLGGGSGAVAASTHAACARFRGTDPLITGVTRRGLAKALGFADEFGWDTLVEAVARARDKLPADERADVGIFANNYGDAGAIDLLGGRFGLPHAMSAHNNYWLWGPSGRPRGPFLIVGGEPESHRAYCGIVEPLARRTCDYCMPLEQDLTIYLCRNPRTPIAEVWSRLRHFD